MVDLQPIPAEPPTLVSVLRSWSKELLLFSIALFVLLMLSRIFLVPHLTSVTVQGMVLTAASAEHTVSQIADEVRELEGLRRDYVLPARDDVYLQLRTSIASTPSFARVRADIEAAIVRTVDGQKSIAISSFGYEPSLRTVTLAGDVHGVGPRSMTILAAFVDELQNIEGVTRVSPPTFERIDDPVRGILSPFSIEVEFHALHANDLQ